MRLCFLILLLAGTAIACGGAYAGNISPVESTIGLLATHRIVHHHKPPPPSSPAPTFSTFFTPSASAAPQLVMNPNPFKKKACSADPCTPVVDGNSGTYNTNWFPGGTVVFPLDDWMIPGHGTSYVGGEEIAVYRSTNATQGYNVNCVNLPGWCSVGVVHIPNGAFADNSVGDVLMSVVNTQTNTDTNFNGWNTGCQTCTTSTFNPVNNGLPNPLWVPSYGEINNTGNGSPAALGNGSPVTCLAGNTNTCGEGSAGYTPQSVDEVDPVEWLQQNIPHTLHLVPHCTASTGFIYPAGGDGGATGPAGTCPPTGEKLWLDWTDAHIESAALPRWAKTMYHNLHDYGWFILDNGPYAAGTNDNALQGISDFSWTAVGQPSQWTIMYNEMTAEGTTLSTANGGQDYMIQLPVAPGLTVANFHWLRYLDQP